MSAAGFQIKDYDSNDDDDDEDSQQGIMTQFSVHEPSHTKSHISTNETSMLSSELLENSSFFHVCAWNKLLPTTAVPN